VLALCAGARMADVFISYSREDRERIAPIVAALTALRVGAWHDARLEAGGAFSEDIQRELHVCRAQIVCWSPAAITSQWVLGEAEIGRQRGVVLPVLLAPCAPPPPFNMMHAEDLSDFSGQFDHAGWAKLLMTLGAKISRPGLAALWPLLADATAAQWKSWAEANPHDPFNTEAWSRYEALHLDAEKSRLAEERAAARTAAEAEVARLAADAARAAAEAERLAKMRAEAEAEAVQARRRAALAADAPPLKPERSPRFPVFLAGAAALGVITVLTAAYILRDMPQPARSAHVEPVQSVTPAAAQAMEFEGRWRAPDDEACALPLSLTVVSNAEGEWLVLRAAVRAEVAGGAMSGEAERRERITGLEAEAVRTEGGLYRPTDLGLEISTPAGAPSLWRRCS
jgi:TIR domain